MELNKKIKIIDMPMGTGKTTGMIEYMNKNPNNKYLFITPFLNEVKRIKDSCRGLDFREPSDQYSKLSDLKNLIANGHNIASTHALFGIIDKDVIELLHLNGYSLIMDEVLEIIEPLSISPKDIHLLFADNIISTDENGLVSVIDKSYGGTECRFTKEIATIKNHSVTFVDNTLLLCLFNSNVFKSLDNIIILTYLFNGSLMKSYFDLYDIGFEYYNIQQGDIIKGKYRDHEFIDNIKALINLYDGKLNNIGDNRTALSGSWYRNKRKKDEHKILKNHMYNYFRNIVKSNVHDAMWSTFTGERERLKKAYAPKSFTKDCFVACNARATNNFAHKKDLIYGVNIFINPYIVRHFMRNGIVLNEDNYALSQMLQWIWRSGIRNGENINLYVPSKRMRELLIEYLSR